MHKNIHALSLLPFNQVPPHTCSPRLPGVRYPLKCNLTHNITTHTHTHRESTQSTELSNRSHYLLSWPHELNPESFIWLSSSPQRAREDQRESVSLVLMKGPHCPSWLTAKIFGIHQDLLLSSAWTTNPVTFYSCH